MCNHIFSEKTPPHQFCGPVTAKWCAIYPDKEEKQLHGHHIPKILLYNCQASGLNPHLFSKIGTKDAKECSDRGYCNRQTGHCMCYSKFSSSDGMGGKGDMGDCGYYDWYDPPTNCTTATPVWGSTSALCSGERNRRKV